MKVIQLPIQGACIVETDRHKDDRGYLQELYNHDKYPAQIQQFFPVKQNTLSSSNKDALRGIHISVYAKLLTCIRGAVYDVVVDMRPESPTYLKWTAAKLTEDNHRQLFIPPNCGHAFYSLQDHSTVVYCQGDCFNPAKSRDIDINPLDPIVNVYWPPGSTPIISRKDRDAECLNAATLGLPITPQERRTRVLIVGASGQVGGALTECFTKHSDRYLVFGTCHSRPADCLVPFDMDRAAGDSEYCDMLLTLCRPHVICICAAFSWVDGNEQQPVKARNVNVEAVRSLCTQAANMKAKVVFYSTDYVFDKDPAEWNALTQDTNGLGVTINAENTGVCLSAHTEDCPTSPLNMYGKLKEEAETVVLNTHDNNIVLRISRVYGPEEQGKNFVYQVCKSLAAGNSMKCSIEEISCPTYNRDIAEVTYRLVDGNHSGLYQCVGPQACTKYQWAIYIAKYFNLDASKIVQIVDSQSEGAKRPRMAAMNNSKLRTLLGDFEFHTFDEALGDWQANSRGISLQDVLKP